MSHSNALKYWTLITQGVNLTFRQLMDLQDRGLIKTCDWDQARKPKKEKGSKICIADQMIVTSSASKFAFNGTSLVIVDNDTKPLAPMLMRDLSTGSDHP